MLMWKIDVIQELKAAGYNTTRIRKEKLLSENSLTMIRAGKVPGIKTLESVCQLLDKQPGTLIRFVPDPQDEE